MSTPAGEESIKLLRSEIDALNTYGENPPNLIVPIENIPQYSIDRTESGKWEKVESSAINPNKLPSVIYSEDEETREDKIVNLERTAAPLDDRVRQINSQINSKKNLIMSNIQSAVSAGCSMIQLGLNLLNPLSPITIILVDAADVNGTGIPIGAGLTVKQDTAVLKYYSNLTDYSTDNPFENDVTTAITSSNLGIGYNTSVGNNDGSVISSDYKEVNIVVSNTPTCIGYYNAITNLANEINQLRSQRNSIDLANTNAIKQEKLNYELARWGSKTTDESISTRTSQIQSSIQSIETIT